MKLLKVTVCIGSGCHVKGSRKIIHRLQQMISKGNLPCEIELEACFCQGKCTEGVVIRVDDEIITGVSTENIENIVLTRLKKEIPSDKTQDQY